MTPISKQKNHTFIFLWNYCDLGEILQKYLFRPGVNLTDILCAAFTHTDTKIVKIQSSCQYLFGLYGSSHS